MLPKAFWLLFAPALFAQGGIEGAVTNSVTHAPVPGVSVTVLGPATYETKSDETGAIRFPSLPAGDYIVQFQARGFWLPDMRRKNVHVEDRVVRLAVELVPLSRLS